MLCCLLLLILCFFSFLFIFSLSLKPRPWVQSFFDMHAPRELAIVYVLYLVCFCFLGGGAFCEFLVLLALPF